MDAHHPSTGSKLHAGSHYGSIITVYTGPDDAITALTDDGIDELKTMIADARRFPESWKEFRDDFVEDAKLAARLEAQSVR
ncbi:hypothetical protein [Pontibaca methylaminivorans]|uniref:Uncharacterized protein n=1 Tax=Pontibaca methylaminivorans TaxID=515897 RepID=A0A1R3X9E6_9RHOB|nr:hypothetical protein [Pontibaca methylaminivorans]SIT87059.1 hypothetical protein SAMN05421849_2537 [Pontibaca methylaminivorans]